MKSAVINQIMLHFNMKVSVRKNRERVLSVICVDQHF